MTATVADVVGKKGQAVLTIDETDSVLSAVEKMLENDIGALVVTRDDAVAGIFTERDYFRRITVQPHPNRLVPVKDVMSSPVIYVTPETPVFVTRYDGHMGLANSLALRLAGITAGTKDPAGGLIVRDAGGEPTGILKDAAKELVERVIPPLSPKQLDRSARQALAHAARHGVTSVQFMSCSYAEFRALAQLAESGELTTRVYAAPIETTWEDQARIGIRRAFGSSYLRLGALKGFADGSLGSSTAYFFDP